ncbi:hypothetical protein Hanom_Chr12g01100781 [Helianthus anomalus]
MEICKLRVYYGGGGGGSGGGDGCGGGLREIRERLGYGGGLRLERKRKKEFRFFLFSIL